MQLMYVDESGDPGDHIYSSPHFILSGLVIDQGDWMTFLDRLKTFRKHIKNTYGLNQRTEIHSSELIRVNKIEEYKKISKSGRINILRDYCTQIPTIFDTAKLINVCIDISQHAGIDIFQLAWQRLIQRYDTYLKRDAKDLGIVVSDDTDSVKLQQLMRKMRIYNPTPSHFSSSAYNAPADNIVEDAFGRSSHHSYFIQSVDVVAHVLYRKEYPKGSLKKYGLEKQFHKFSPILLKKASKSDPYGIVRK